MYFVLVNQIKKMVNEAYVSVGRVTFYSNGSLLEGANFSRYDSNVVGSKRLLKQHLIE